MHIFPLWFPLLLVCLENHALSRDQLHSNTCIFQSFKTGVPNPWIHSLLGTRSHSRRWAAGAWVKLHLQLPIAPHRLHYRLSHLPPARPRPWKDCLPQNRSLVPKRLGTAVLRYSFYDTKANCESTSSVSLLIQAFMEDFISHSNQSCTVDTRIISLSREWRHWDLQWLSDMPTSLAIKLQSQGPLANDRAFP